MLKKFQNPACSTVSTPSFSSECTLHTTDFASTQSDISQLADMEKVELGGVEEEKKDEDGERLSSSSFNRPSSAHGNYRPLQCEEEDIPFHQLSTTSVEIMVTPVNSVVDLVGEAWAESAQLLTSPTNGCGKLEVPSNGEVADVEDGLSKGVAEDGQGGVNWASISGLVEEDCILAEEEVVHHHLALSPQETETGRHSPALSTECESSSPLLDAFSHPPSALGHDSCGVLRTHVSSDQEEIINSPSSPSSSSSFSSSLCSTLHHHSIKLSTRELTSSHSPAVRMPTVTLNLPASSPLSYHFGSVVSAAQSTILPLSRLSAFTSHSSSETSIGREE